MKVVDLQAFRERVLYPCVRVRTAKAGGSGQVVHVSDENGTFILTCEHVVDDAISVKEEWSHLLGRKLQKDVMSPVSVEFFVYAYQDRAIGSTTAKADIISYDKNEDIALLRLEADPRRDRYVAEMLKCDGPEDDGVKERIDYTAQVITVGAALGSDPVMTAGNLCGFGILIDNREYWLSTAPSIFGNSGGATFLADTWEFIGMPARIAVTGAFGSDAITHMGYIVPITRIVQFLKDNMMTFLLGDGSTYKENCDAIRAKREAAERELRVQALKGESA